MNWVQQHELIEDYSLDQVLNKLQLFQEEIQLRSEILHIFISKNHEWGVWMADVYYRGPITEEK